MLQLSTTFYNRKILSLRTGGPIGFAHSPLINPTTLKIEGWYASAAADRTPYIVPANEVRDIITKGIVVNDHASLTHVEDLVRLKEIIELRFELIGKVVKTDRKRKLGKVHDYAVDDQALIIKQLYVAQNVLKSLIGQQLIIDRTQIIEINDRAIIVKEPTVKARATQQAPATI